MEQPDLTPSVYIKRSRTRVAIHRWMIPIVIAAIVAVVPVMLEHTQAPDPSGKLAEERMLQAQSRLTKSQREITSLTAQLKQRQRELQAEQHLTRRPDWAGVMMLVAGQFDEKLMLTGIQLDDAKENNVRSALGPLARDVKDDSVWMILTGVAETNSDVPGLILRLEKLGLFERIVMTGTQRESFAGSARTSFTLACRVE